MIPLHSLPNAGFLSETGWDCKSLSPTCELGRPTLVRIALWSSRGWAPLALAILCSLCATMSSRSPSQITSDSTQTSHLSFPIISVSKYVFISSIVSNTFISVFLLDREWGIDPCRIMWGHAGPNYEEADPSWYDVRNRRVFQNEPGSTSLEYQGWPWRLWNHYNSVIRSSYGLLQVLQYGQSEYVRAFGMSVTPTPISVQARVLAPPVLRYGPGSAEATIVSWFFVGFGFC